MARNLPVELIHMIIEHLDLDVPEGKVACRSASLVHRSWTHLAQRRLFDIFRADFPRCIPALVSLSNTPRLATYVSRLDPRNRLAWRRLSQHHPAGDQPLEYRRNHRRNCERAVCLPVS
jgi:hypothetical protein